MGTCGGATKNEFVLTVDGVGQTFFRKGVKSLPVAKWRMLGNKA